MLRFTVFAKTVKQREGLPFSVLCVNNKTAMLE